MKSRVSLQILLSALGLVALTGCHNDMWRQPKVKPQHQSDFFPDQQGSRPLVPHSVDRTHFFTDTARYTGYENDNKITEAFPFKITKEDILRGQDRFNIFCSPCHGALGNGQGMIAQRGFALRRPPGNYQTEKLRKQPVGHFYDVITNGFGTMYSYASRIEPDDRWRIVAYIRVLQRSQNATLADVPTDIPADARREIDNYTPPAGGQPGADNPSGTLLPPPQRPLDSTPVPNVPNGNGNGAAAPLSGSMSNTPGTPSGANPGTPPAQNPTSGGRNPQGQGQAESHGMQPGSGTTPGTGGTR